MIKISGRRYISGVQTNTNCSIVIALLGTLTVLTLVYWTLQYCCQSSEKQMPETHQSKRCHSCMKKLHKSIDYLIDQNYTGLQTKIQALEEKLKLYETVGRLTEENSLVNSYGNKVRQNILLISCMYCGSWFLGEMLNQHPHVFYLQEPVEALEYYRDNRPESIYDAMVTHLLNGIFHCNFRELAYLTDFLSLQYSSLKHRLASRALSEPPLCPDQRGHSFNIRTCTRLRPETVSAICNLHKHTVVKTVQVDFIHKLSYLMDSEGPADYALKVVHLVRDPRALMDAHVGHVKDTNWTLTSLRQHAQVMCKELLLNIKYAVSAPPWLQGRYTLLRYEDLATKPHQIAEQLYQFVGIPIASQVRRWIDRAHKESVPSFSGMSDTVVISSELGSPQSLIVSVDKWRERMPYSVVRIIETECYEVMNLLGYKIVDDEEELRTITIPLVD